MQFARPVGREAASRKYDLLSALAAFALSQDRTRQRRSLRLMALITTRYNWQRDELTLGMTEIAKLWSVDPRTVKREMSALRASAWLVLKRQGARGRVSVYGLGIDAILADTRPAWDRIGPDFIDRMSPTPAPDTNVVPLRAVAAPVSDGSTWAAAQGRLHEAAQAQYGAWLAALTEIACREGVLSLMAPSRFHASYVQTHLAGTIMAAVRQVDPSLREVRIEAG